MISKTSIRCAVFILVLTSVFSLQFASVALASDPAPAAPARSAQDEKIDNLLPAGPNTGIVGGKYVVLPSGDLQTGILPRAVKIMLMLMGSVTFCIFVYTGIMLVIAQGNDEDITKFKNTLIWSAIGLAFVIMSYAIVNGILHISFTDNP